jgi:hypothetical protein
VEKRDQDLTHLDCLSLLFGFEIFLIVSAKVGILENISQRNTPVVTESSGTGKIKSNEVSNDVRLWFNASDLGDLRPDSRYV